MASVQRATRHESYFLLCSQHALENEELTQHLGAAKDAQRQLTAEVRRCTPFHHNRDFLWRSLEPRYQPDKKMILFPLLFVSQLRELEDKYAECIEMLQEAQEELKNLRNKTLPLNTPRRFHSLGLFPMVSCLCKHHPSVSYIVPGAPENLVMFRCSPPGLSGSRNRGHHEEGASDG